MAKKENRKWLSSIGFMILGGILFIGAIVSTVLVIEAANNEQIFVTTTTHAESYMLQNNGTLQIISNGMTHNCSGTENEGSFYYSSSTFYMCDGVSWKTIGSSSYTNGTGLELNGSIMQVLLPYRLPQACSDGQFAVWNTTPSPDRWDCTTVSGTGTVTSVTRGYGFNNTGTSITTTGTLNINTSIIQARVGQSCSAGNSIRAIDINGNVTCEADSEGSDSQTLTYTTSTDEISISGGNTIDISEVDTNDSANINLLISSNTTQANAISILQSDNTTQASQINALNISKLNISDQRYNETSGINALNTSKMNVSDQRYNETSLVNAKHTPANCPSGQAVQNTTTSGVQCIGISSSSFTYSDYFNQFLNTTSNVTFNKITGNGTGINSINCSSIVQDGGGSDTDFCTDSTSAGEGSFDLNITSQSGSGTIEDSEIFTINGANGISTSISGNTVTITGTVYNDTIGTNGSGISLVGTQFNHSDTSTQASSDNSARTYIQDLLLDTFGHITSITTATETVTDTDTWNTTEQMQDATGAMVFNTSSIFMTYNDASNQLYCTYNSTFFDANYVGQSEYANLDTDSTNDLTTSTSFTGDITGNYNTLQIGADTVGDSELNTSQITLSDFTNDTNFITDGNVNWDNSYGYWNNIANFSLAATYSTIVSEFTTCTGTERLAADGDCYADDDTPDDDSEVPNAITINGGTISGTNTISGTLNGNFNITGNVNMTNYNLTAKYYCYNEPCTKYTFQNTTSGYIETIS